MSSSNDLTKSFLETTAQKTGEGGVKPSGCRQRTLAIEVLGPVGPCWVWLTIEFWVLTYWPTISAFFLSGTRQARLILHALHTGHAKDGPKPCICCLLSMLYFSRLAFQIQWFLNCQFESWFLSVVFCGDSGSVLPLSSCATMECATPSVHHQAQLGFWAAMFAKEAKSYYCWEPSRIWCNLF